MPDIELVECPVCHCMTMPRGNYTCSAACSGVNKKIAIKEREKEMKQIIGF